MIKDNVSFQCHICKSGDVLQFDSFENLGRVTSDCKPLSKGGGLCICKKCFIVQKVIDNHWREEANQIYSEYQLYHQTTSEKEQPVFNSETGAFLPRSMAVLNYLKMVIQIKKNISVIDIGCGVGSMLKAISNTYTTAKLYGFDPNIHKQEKLEKINNVIDIYTKIEQFNNATFDLLTMIHVLEHIDSPLEVLKKYKNNIKAAGYLVIVVPDHSNNPFDLVIADHASHFSLETLRNLLLKSGFEILTISNKVINKEIIAVCSIASNKISNNESVKLLRDNSVFVQKQLNWLSDIITNARATCGNRPFGIFGTSIAANWIYGELDGKIDFFVDEDEDKVNRVYHQKPVYPINKIPTDSHIFVCLQPNVVGKVIGRIRSPKYHLYAPPDF